jgi:hypothetical protein
MTHRANTTSAHFVGSMHPCERKLVSTRTRATSLLLASARFGLARRRGRRRGSPSSAVLAEL